MNNTPDTVIATVYVRHAQLQDPTDDRIDALRHLESTGRLDDLSLETWPETITLSERGPYSDALEAFERMAAWATEYECSIHPPFSVRTTTSAITDTTQIRLRTPMLCLAISVSGQLASVFPRSQDDRQYSIADAITALRTDDIEAFPFAPTTGAPPERCPACETWLTPVQGLGVCRDSERIELGTVSDRDRGQRTQFVQRP